MLAYIEDCNIKNVIDNDIIYVLVYDNNEEYEDHVEHIEAVFDDYNNVIDFFENKYVSREYQMRQIQRETVTFCADDDVEFLRILQEEWHSDAEDDYYDPVGYYIVKKFNKNEGNELFNIIEIVK